MEILREKITFSIILTDCTATLNQIRYCQLIIICLSIRSRYNSAKKQLNTQNKYRLNCKHKYTSNRYNITLLNIHFTILIKILPIYQFSYITIYEYAINLIYSFHNFAMCLFYTHTNRWDESNVNATKMNSSAHHTAPFFVRFIVFYICPSLVRCIIRA